MAPELCWELKVALFLHQASCMVPKPGLLYLVLKCDPMFFEPYNRIPKI